MKTTTFARKPFYVQALRVTEENFEQVAKWVGGAIHEVKQGKFIEVDVQRFLYERQKQAFVGDWILASKVGEKDSFKVYTDAAFRKSFDEVPVDELAKTLKQHFAGEGQTEIQV